MPDSVPEPGTRERLLNGLFKPTRSQLVVGLLLAVLGFAAVTQVRVTETDDTYSGLRQQELIDILSALAGARQRAEAEIAELEDVRDDLRGDTSRRQAALQQAQDDVAELNILAGLVPVTGPGVRLTIEEDTGRVTLSTMLDVIQELRTARAEAIQINGTVRVIAQTSFEETEGGFLVDGELVEPPYLIDAIGEPSLLASSLDLVLGPRLQITEDGASLEVDELNSVDIESVRDPEEPGFASPDPG